MLNFNKFIVLNDVIINNSTNVAIDKDSDEYAIWQLWNKEFGDDKEFVFYYINHFSNCTNYILLRNSNNIPIGMVHFPMFYTSIGQVGYMYALTIIDECRSKGYATQILSMLFKAEYLRGDILCASIPASESLTQWYTSRFNFVRGYRELPICFQGVADFDFGNENANTNFGIYRIINAKKYLQRYAELYPTFSFILNYTDPILPENDGEYNVSNGNVVFKPVSTNNGLLPEDLYTNYRIEDTTLIMQ